MAVSAEEDEHDVHPKNCCPIKYIFAAQMLKFERVNQKVLDYKLSFDCASYTRLSLARLSFV